MFTILNSIFDGGFQPTKDNLLQLSSEIDENIEKSWKQPFCVRPTKSTVCKSILGIFNIFNKEVIVSKEEQAALDFYIGNRGCFIINESLRGNRIVTDENKKIASKYIEIIDKILWTKARRTPQTMFLIRGTKGKTGLKYLKLNKFVEFPSYTSSTFEKLAASGFVSNSFGNVKYYDKLEESKKNLIHLLLQKSEQTEFKTCCYLILRIPQGTPFIYMKGNINDKEEEILLPRGMFWKLINMMVLDKTAYFFIDVKLPKKYNT